MRPAFIIVSLFALAACAEDKAPAGKALSCAASADGAVTVENAWIREQADPSAMSAAYFSVCNGTMSPVTLTGLSTPLAGIVELHETSRDANGVVSMAPAGELVLAPGERLLFEPGGRHAMLMSLSGAIESGESAPLTLEFADGTSLAVEAIAKSAAEAAAQANAHKGH